VSFDLTKKEAEFLQKRLESLPGCLLSSAASRAGKLLAKAESLWDDQLILEAASDRRESEMIARARRASSLGYLVRAIYGALVERRRNETAGQAHLSHITNRSYYRELLQGLFGGEEGVFGDIRELDLDLLMKDLPKLPARFLCLIRHVKERADRVKRRADVDLLLDNETLELFSKEEERRKQERARLPDNQFGAERRDDFDENTLNVFPINYRWSVVRTLLRDLHNGLRF
jgi:hypothetical protein